MHGDLWTHEEIEFLKNNYYSASNEKIVKNLPGRTWEAIKTKAKKFRLERSVIFRTKIMREKIKSRNDIE